MSSSRFVVALAGALVCLTSVAHAEIRVRGITPLRWGISSESLGLPATSTLEDFEDTTLAPGLQVSWQSSGGNTAPISTLPATYNCTAGDANGTAFIGGNWDGTRALISGRNNQSYNYGTGFANWGHVTLHFNPPVRAVGFSLHQADTDLRFVVNGTLAGSIGSTGLTANGAKVGYVLIQATGSDTISTLQINNNQTGDGCTIDHLQFTTESLPDVTVTGFNTRTVLSDAALGITDATIENFEDATLVQGMQYAVESQAGNYGPATTLPNLFTAGPDPFGTAFTQGAWDGTKCLLDTRSNQTFNYASIANWGDVAFTFDTPVYLVGFSLADMEGPTRLIVNGHDLGAVHTLSGLPLVGSQRNGYLKIGTPGPATIKSVRLANNRLSNGYDGWAIDHLAFITCAADFNNDGFLTFEDFDAYVAVFETGC
ncbi:MAG: hypothetical protein SFY96_07860 [Planctomycetota bacterium]|nr:hypothetical protein [Planctomycetota bacterium]